MKDDGLRRLEAQRIGRRRASMARILVVLNEGSEKAKAAMDGLAPYLAAEGHEVAVCGSGDLPSCRLDRKPPVPACDLIVVLGGDGTILRSARLGEQLDAPLLGVNFGHLGFLANSCEQGVAPLVEAALKGRAEVEHRTNLRVEAIDDEGSRSCFALNEVVVRSAAGHIVDFAMDIDGGRVARMRADGMVVATATGSTAYALSAGGPLVSPAYPGIVVVPVAPHTLTSRAICTEVDDVVDIVLDGHYGPDEVAVFLDGDSLPLRGRLYRVRVHTGARPTRLLRLGEVNFYKRVAGVFFH